MPGKVKIRILAGRNLPVMDRSSDTTDAYVEVKLGNTTFKTDVVRKSLNPQFNSEWFIFEVDDLDLQDEPLQIRLMDHDTYSANDAIGKVYVDLNPLLLAPAQLPSTKVNQESTSNAGIMSGWLPVYDTMHGIRGEVNIFVKVDLFTDFNKFRQSSCGVQFFFTAEIPFGFRCNSIIGFVEELVVNDDPEYQWIDKIRTPRASNEARQTLFLKLSGELQRRIGLKVLEQGGNAVIGYRQCFDLEGESGIVVRGIGSVVSLARIHYDGAINTGTIFSPSPVREFGNCETMTQRDLVDPSAEHSRSGLSPSTVSPKRGSRSRKISSTTYSMSRSPQMPEGGDTAILSQSPTNSVKIASPSHPSGTIFNRRSSDSDISITPKGGSLTGSGGSSGGRMGMQGASTGCHKPMMSQESFENLIYPFLTMKSFPPEFIVHLGGTVSARSVKLLDRSHMPEEMDSRDSWWAHIRTEIRSHARSIACNVVLGYEEFTTICDEVCVLSATGTAAVINVSYQEVENMAMAGPMSRSLRDPMSLSCEKKDLDLLSKGPIKESQVCLRLKASSPRPLRRLIQQQSAMCRSHPNVIEDMGDSSSGLGTAGLRHPPLLVHKPGYSPCSMCHIPYNESSNPYNVRILKCGVCRKGKVPDVIITTLELPAGIPVTGQGCLIQARVVRTKKDLKGELNAKEISDSLPFLEYELHKQLYQKTMMKGMNALFGLRVRVTVGEKLVVGLGTGTAVFLTALPQPPMPRISLTGATQDEENRKSEIQRKIRDAFEKNKEIYGIKWTDPPEAVQPAVSKSSDTEDSEEELLEFDLSSGNKDAYVLDLDDLEDVEMLQLLLERSQPPQCITVSTQTPPGFPLEQTVSNLQMFTKVWKTKVPPNVSRTIFSSYFDILFQSLYFKIRNLSPCVLAGLRMDVELPEEDEIQVNITGMVLGQGQPAYIHSSNGQLRKTKESSVETKVKQDDNDLIFSMEGVKECEEKAASVPPTSSNIPQKTPCTITQSCSIIPGTALKSTSSTQSFQSAPSFPSVSSAASISSGSSSGRSSLKARMKKGDKKSVSYHLPPKADHFGVEITPLSFIPGARIERYLGNLNFFFIRESTSIKENGGLSAFMGSFATEVLALVRAHVAAIGGNALISYFLSECILLHNPHKNQGQCLINVGGDIVHVAYCNPIHQHLEQSDSNPQTSTTLVEPKSTSVVGKSELM